MPKPPKFYNPDASLGMPASAFVAASPMTSDDEDMFNLDMVTMNMDFEQAYSMYSKLQKKNVLLQVDQLRKAQEQNASKARTQLYVNSQSVHAAPDAHHSLSMPSLLGLTTISMPQVVHDTSVSIAPPELKTSINFGGPAPEEEATEDLDKFFTHTESDAIERFLDNLAGGALVNTTQDPKSQYNMNNWYELSNNQEFMLPELSVDDVKKEITDAFQHPPVSSLRSFGSVPMVDPLSSSMHIHNDVHGLHSYRPVEYDARLSLPLNLNDQSSSASPTDLNSIKRSFDSESSSSPDQALKRSRLNSKSLLTTEQKRLNHSLLEQKRRLLCREAYERCLRLVTNVEEYKKEMAQAGQPSSKKKPSRKQLLKNGLPNLSKHTSLVKISNEITKIQGQNDRLRALLAGKV